MKPKVESAKVARRRYVLSIVLGVSFLCMALYLYLITETETRAVTIGAAPTTGMLQEIGIIAAGASVLGILIIGMSSLFYLGWKHDYLKQGGS